ncbi:hypothetical protein ACIPEN_02600 [Herbaspirillum chlorophenolicum]|uniref:Type III effector n=1 Tax=Herbaspirillum chlorophenolicum TaxID=211589 RepID=A0ABW8ETB2_9BURK
MQVSPTTNITPVDGAHSDAITPVAPRAESPVPPPSRGVVSEQAVRSGNSMELVLRSAQSRSAGAIPNETPEERQQRFDGLEALARKHMIAGRHEEPEQLEARIQQRAQRMLERGENPHQLESLFTFADLAIDLPADIAHGFFNGIPFSLANLTAKFLPAMAAYKGGALSGAITILMVHFGSHIVNGVGETPRWGNTTKALEDIIPEEDPRGSLTALDVFKKIGTTFQLFPAAYTLTGGVTSGIARKDLDSGLKAQYGIGPGTAAVASGVVNGAGHFVDRYYGRIDPGHILSEEDWENSLDELKRATFKGAAANGLAHMFSADAMARAGDGLKKAVMTLPNLSTLAQALVWTGGVSLYSHVTAEMNKNPNLSETDKFVNQQMMFAAFLFPITFLWTASIALGPQLDKKMSSAITATLNQLRARETPRLPQQ